MTERLRRLTDEELGEALTDLGRDVSYPPTPNLSRAVGERLATGPTRRPAPWRPWLEPGWRAAAVGAAAILLVLFGSVVFSPSVRRAVADLLGVRGIDIEITDEAPSPVGGSLELGERVSLAQAEQRVGFGVMVPDALGAPDEVYFGEPPAGGQVSLVYRPRDDLPRSSESGVGALLTQFRGDLLPEFGKKLIEPGTRLQGTDVNGLPAYWIEGAPHVFLYRDADGRVVEESVRLADHVLLWEQGGITFRLESSLPLDEALRVAESLS